MKDLSALLEKANQATPPETMGARSQYKQFIPVVKVLIEQRGFDLKSAVNWLVEMGELKQERVKLAYRSLSQVFQRIEKKKAA